MTTALDTAERTYAVSFSGTVTVTVDEAALEDGTDEHYEFLAREIAEDELVGLDRCSCSVDEAELVSVGQPRRPVLPTPSAHAPVQASKEVAA